MLNIMNRAPWLMNNTPQGYHEQYEAAIKRMFNGSITVEPIERERRDLHQCFSEQAISKRP